MDSKTLATLAFLDAFGADQGLLTYFADLSGPGLLYHAFIQAFIHHVVLEQNATHMSFSHTTNHVST